MNLNELKALNAQTIDMLNIYHEMQKNHGDAAATIKHYYLAKHNSTIIESYKKVFEINALEFAHEVNKFLKEKTGCEYFLDIALESQEKAEIKDEFGPKYIEKYNYTLVLKNKNDFEAKKAIPVAKCQSSMVSNNEKVLHFDKTEAMKSFERTTVNLIGSNPIYIPNYERPAPCAVAEEFGMQDFLWEIVAKQIAKKKEAKIAKIKAEILNLEKQQDLIEQENVDYIAL